MTTGGVGLNHVESDSNAVLIDAMFHLILLGKYGFALVVVAIYDAARKCFGWATEIV